MPARSLHRKREIVFYAGPGDADGIDLLESVVTDNGSGNLAAENNQGNGIHISRCNTRNGIGNPRTGCDKYHAGTTRCPGIAVCCMCGALLVTHEDMFNLCLLVKFVVNMQHCAAGITKNMFYPSSFNARTKISAPRSIDFDLFT